MDFSTFPLPPPWRSDNQGESVVYINDLTGQQSTTHPLQEFFSQNEDEVENISTIECHQSPTKVEEYESPVPPSNTAGFHFAYLPYRCEWKEVTLNGLIKAYGMDLLYFLEDKHFEITFDGVHASWVLSKIDGPFGPIDENDLFIGAKIKVFNRHLSITSSNSHVCHMVDKRAEALTKRRDWLQEKIEVFGATPIIQRIHKPTQRHIARSSNTSGTANLRKLQIEILKLNEQVGSLGIAHILSQGPRV